MILYTSAPNSLKVESTILSALPSTPEDHTGIMFTRDVEQWAGSADDLYEVTITVRQLPNLSQPNQALQAAPEDKTPFFSIQQKYDDTKWAPTRHQWSKMADQHVINWTGRYYTTREAAIIEAVHAAKKEGIEYRGPLANLVYPDK